MGGSALWVIGWGAIYNFYVGIKQEHFQTAIVVTVDNTQIELIK